MLRNPAAELAWREGPAGIGLFLPGAAQAGSQRAGEQELGVRGHDEPGPAVGLPGIADFRGGESEGALEELEGVLDVEPGEVGAPELVQGQGAGSGVPQPHGAVRVAAVRQAFDGDVDEGAVQDGQLLSSGEPAAVAVDEGMDAVPGPGPDGAVKGRVRQRELLVGFRVPGSGFGGRGFFRPLGPWPASAAKSAGFRQCTAGPRRAGRPSLPSQVTGSA